MAKEGARVEDAADDANDEQRSNVPRAVFTKTLRVDIRNGRFGTRRERRQAEVFHVLAFLFLSVDMLW